MKKMLAVLLVLLITLAFTACDKDFEDAAAGEGTVTSTNLTDDTSQETQDSTTQETTTTETTIGTTLEKQDNTQNTTEGTTGETNLSTTTPPPSEQPATTPPVTTPPTTPPATQPVQPHTHSYTAQITTASTCTITGVKTFTCSCGSSYTENIKATGHSYLITDSKKETCTEGGYNKYTCSCGDSYIESINATGLNMSGWKTHTSATKFTAGEKRNTCQNCGKYEVEMQYDTMFNFYARIVGHLPGFSKPQDIQANIADCGLIAAASNVVGETSWSGEYTWIFTVKVSDMDLFTNKCFGTTFDFSNIKTAGFPFEESCVYDKNTESIIVTGGIGGGSQYAVHGIKYTTTDNVHFTITITHFEDDRGEYYSTMTVELIDGRYIITSNI